MSRKIVFDVDNPEWTANDFKSAKPPHEALSPELLRAFPKTRGPQKTATKEAISIRLDRDVIEKFRRMGPGWQSRINEVLKHAKVG